MLLFLFWHSIALWLWLWLCEPSIVPVLVCADLITWCLMLDMSACQRWFNLAQVTIMEPYWQCLRLIIKSIHLFRIKNSICFLMTDCLVSPHHHQKHQLWINIHCTLCLCCCQQNKVPPSRSELCQWLMCNNCSLSTDYTINISVDISGVWSIINSSTSTRGGSMLARSQFGLKCVKLS